ncbi:hypothetical protein JCM5350_001042 [Sporobolomyces pararoseus]
MIRLPRSLVQVSRVRYASTATESSNSTPAPLPFSSPSPSPSSQSTSITSSSNSQSPSTSTPSSSSSSSSSSLSPNDSPSSDLSPVFGRHVPLAQTHGVHVATLHLRSYTSSIPDLQFFTSFALRSARALGLPTSGAVALPTRTSLFTVPRSPFAHKKSQQNFWRKEHKRAIKVWDGNPQVVDAWLAYLRKEAMGGVGMKAQVFTYSQIGWGQELGKSTEEGTLQVQEDELLELAARGGDGNEIESLARELQEDLEAEIEQNESQTTEEVRQTPRKELEEVVSDKTEAKPKEEEKK